MKILVTGGAGFIGSHVVDAFVAAGHEVVALDDLSSGRRSNLNPAARLVEMDIRSPELRKLLAEERPEAISHHAAQIDVRRSVSDPEFDAAVNVVGTLNLLEGAREAGVGWIVYASTGGAVYGEPEYLPCDEEHPIRPLAPYGASKHAVEHYLELYRANYGLEYTSLRYPNVFGPRQDPHGEAGVVAIFTQKMLAGEQPMINGDGEQQRDFLFVADCARANLIALELRASGTYNLGTGRGTSINELYEQLATITGFDRPPAYGPAKLGETRVIYLDAGKARRELAWEPSRTLEEGLAETVHYFREHER